MKKIISILFFLVPLFLSAQEFDFTREYDVIPVSFDGVECQVPWTTGYNYIHPTFCDLDADGDYDLIFGSDWKRTSFYMNNGSITDFDFNFITDSIVEMPGIEPQSQRPNHPSFCDIDNDGDFDLFIGTYYSYPLSTGGLFFYRNEGNATSSIFIFQDSLFQNIQLQTNNNPFFVDIDNDGDYDLFIGFSLPWTSPAGKLSYYINAGTPDSASMVLVSNYFMNIDLGYECVPAFIDIDNDADYDMFLGDEDGRIHFYRNEGTPEVYDFVLVTDNYFNIDVGFIASPTFCDIDGDGDFDLFVGSRSWGQDNTHGDIWFYENIGTPDSADFQLVTQNFICIDIGTYASLDFADINNDSLKEMFIGESDGNINYFENFGTLIEPQFSLITETFQNLAVNYQSRPIFGDLDGDGDLDLIASKGSFGSASLSLYRNNGTPEEPDFVLINNNYLGTFWGMLFPRLIDIDADGDLDLFIGNDSNQVAFWENQGTPFNPQFALMDSDFLNTPTGFIDMCTICFGDLDGDGDYDLLRGNNSATILMLEYYENIGSPTSPNFILTESPFLGLSAEFINCPSPYLEDIDNDGDLDLFVGDGLGGVSFWRNNEIDSVNRELSTVNRSFTLLPNYPNPFNAVTTIPFTLDQKLPVKIVIYNQLGQNIVTLFDGMMDSGIHQVNWEAGGVSSGVYLIRLDTQAGYSESRKVMLVK